MYFDKHQCQYIVRNHWKKSGSNEIKTSETGSSGVLHREVASLLWPLLVQYVEGRAIPAFKKILERASVAGYLGGLKCIILLICFCVFVLFR